MHGSRPSNHPPTRQRIVLTSGIFLVIVLLGMLLFVSPQITRADSSLASPWADQDIGTVGQAGNASFASDSSTFTIDSSGRDIWGTADGFHYVYQPLLGDGQMIARVDSITNTDIWTKAGVMIRENLTANARNSMIEITSGTVANFQWRATAGANSASLHGPVVRAPYWVMLVRTGSTFTGSISSDGATWSVVGSTTLSIPAQAYIGLAVTAHNNKALATASFDAVQAASVASKGTIVARSVTGPQVPVGQKGSVTATCQSGEQLISGGFTISAFEYDNVVESYPSAADAWTVTDDNTGAPSWVGITAIAYCLQADYSIGATIVHTTNTGTSAITSACPANAVVTGGGFQGFGVSSSAPTTDGWSSNGKEVYAICATQNLAPASNASATFIVYSGGPLSGAATCASGLLATGGGWSFASGSDPLTVNVQTDTNGWLITTYGLSYTSPTVTVSAVCISPPALG